MTPCRELSGLGYLARSHGWRVCESQATSFPTGGRCSSPPQSTCRLLSGIAIAIMILPHCRFNLLIQSPSSTSLSSEFRHAAPLPLPRDGLAQGQPAKLPRYPAFQAPPGQSDCTEHFCPFTKVEQKHKTCLNFLPGPLCNSSCAYFDIYLGT